MPSQDHTWQPFTKRTKPTKSEWARWLDAKGMPGLPLYELYMARNGQQLRVQFGNWCYSHHKQVFDRLYQDVLDDPSKWEEVRNA